MITPEEFPYIKSLHVNDCYAYQNFDINLHDYKPFSHLILTGKNGSGKSTILRAIHQQFFPVKLSEWPKLSVKSKVPTEEGVQVYENIVSGISSAPRVLISFSIFHELNTGGSGNRLMFSNEIFNLYTDKVYSYFKAKRIGEVLSVEAPSKESEFTEKFNTADSTEFYISKFRQYLVNRKVEQAFSQIESETERVQNVQYFFDSLKDTLNRVFEGELTDLEFSRSSYEFYLKLSDNRKLTFNTLSEGFSAFISIFMDLFIRVDLIRKQVNDYSYNPCGIVLIDEPETHLHLQLQEQVLPLLTSLFPNVQFIAATHSPAVIASIRNATIFDLTTKENRISEDTAGRSYSELMMAHFGMDNEYSTIADELIRQIDSAVSELAHDPVALQKRLRTLYNEQGQLLSPTLKIKLELLIAQQEVQQAIAQ